MNAESLGHLVTSEPNACFTVMRVPDGTPTFAIPDSAWALQVSVGESADVAVHIPLENKFSRLYSRAVESMSSDGTRQRIRLVEASQSYELALCTETTTEGGEEVFFDITDPICLSKGFKRLPKSIPFDVDHIYAVLECAADFFWDLRRSRRSPKTVKLSGLASYITFEAWQISESDTIDDYGPNYKPTGEKLNDDAGYVQIPITDNYSDSKYGFRLTSTYPYPLYVWLFSFNISELSVGAFIL